MRRIVIRFRPRNRWRLGDRFQLRCKKKFTPFWLAALFILATAFFLAGCGGDECGVDINCVALAEQSAPYPSGVETGTVDEAIGQGHAISRDARYTTGWLWIYFWISILPVIALMVPGSGRPEKFGEGGVLFLISWFLYAHAARRNYTYLDSLSAMLMGAGVLLLLWGIISAEQSGKVKFFLGVPVFINFIFWLIFFIGAVAAGIAVGIFGLLAILGAKVLGLYLAFKIWRAATN